MTRVAFIGAGRWALALALNLTKRGIGTALWEPDAGRLENLLTIRRHPDLPVQATIPPGVELSTDLPAVCADARLVVFAVPSQALADAARHCAAQVQPCTQALVTVTKGIDPSSLERLSKVIAGTIPGRPVVVLAGPGIPYDFALGDPTSLVAASEDDAAAQTVRDLLTGGNLRIYSASDVVGVELGAALKNVVALAAGIADGLGLGLNAKAALLTRGLTEMSRLGLALNANPLTFSGLSGMGDLIVTAFSEHSRNHVLGRLIGAGQSLEQAQATLNGVAEGAATCSSARQLGLRLHVELPITEEVYRILYEGRNAKESLARLLHRTPKKETN